MNAEKRELASLRNKLNEFHFNDYYGLKIPEDSEVACWVQRFEMLAQDLDEGPYKAPQMHWD